MTMTRNRKSTSQRANDSHVLSQIVEAMLEAEAALQTATVDEWQGILVASCRRQKRDSDGHQFAMSAT